MNSIIRIIMRAPGQTDPATCSVEEPNDNGLLSLIEDDLSTFRLDSYKPPTPWDDILTEADYYYYGVGDKIEDHREALRLYKQAAKLGSLVAYQRIGDMYEYGDGVRKDDEQALQYYKEGARRGNYYCFMSMAHVFAVHSHKDNFRKCANCFFDTRAKRILVDVEEADNTYPLACYLYLQACILKEYSIEHVEELRAGKNGLIAIMEAFCRKKNGDQSFTEKVQGWVRNNL